MWTPVTVEIMRAVLGMREEGTQSRPPSVSLVSVLLALSKPDAFASHLEVLNGHIHVLYDLQKYVVCY